MCDVGESQQQLLERFEGSLVGPSIRPVPFTNPDGSEGTDLYLAPEAFHEAFAADVDPETAAVMAAAQRPYAAAAFAATPSARQPGIRCRAGICSVPRTRRSRRHSSGSWPSARTQRSWRFRPALPAWRSRTAGVPAGIRSAGESQASWLTRHPRPRAISHQRLVPRRPVLLVGRFEFLHLFIGQFQAECVDCLR